MILCDIGNTSVDILYENGNRMKIAHADFDPVDRDVYFISVKKQLSNTCFERLNWINIESWIDRSKYYQTMGIDRIMVCEAVEDGVIVDAGSAITVDIMENGVYKGGTISLGVRAAQEAYGRISPALSVSFNFEVDLDTIAKNTTDSITLGYLAPLIHYIKRFDKPVYITGGDADIIGKLIGNCNVDPLLIFKGMQKVIEKRLGKC